MNVLDVILAVGDVSVDVLDVTLGAGDVAVHVLDVIPTAGVGNFFVVCHDIPALGTGGVGGHRGEALVAGAIIVVVSAYSRVPE